MKKFIGVLFVAVIPGLLASAVITEITVNESVKLAESVTKPSFYWLLAYLVTVLIYFLSQSYLKRFISDQKEKIIKGLKDDLKTDLKNQIKKELRNEINQSIVKESKGVKNEIRGLMNGNFKQDLKRELVFEVKVDLRDDIEKATAAQYQLMEAYVYKLILQSSPPSGKNLMDMKQLHRKLDSMDQNFQKFFAEKMGG